MRRIGLFLGPEHPCSYLQGQIARSVYVDASSELNTSIYSRLAEQGFRRSGDLVYRPNCTACASCVPIRIPVSRFSPNRSQLRTLRNNTDLTIARKPAEFDEEHYRLFQHYLAIRHEGGGMTDTSPEEYIEFLRSYWADTSFIEFRSKDRLLTVAVVDRLDSGLSAVYTFFDPAQAGRGLGTFAVLWQIGEAARLELEWLYLGFWLRDCRKMSYKDRFRPLQALIGGSWQTFEKGGKIPP